MPTDPKLLSVAEVCELVPGGESNPTWINTGFSGVVREIKRTTVKKTGRPMNICTIADAVGSAVISMTVFNAVSFNEGDLIEVVGQGLRRTEYNGLAQVSLSQKSEIHVLGRSVHHEEQKERVAESLPALNGQSQPVPGQTVGMAMKEALTALVPGNGARMNTTAFWFEVHQFASDVIRVSRQLEAGKLAPSVKERTATKPNPQPDTPPPPPPAVRRSAPASTPEIEEEPPF